MSTPAFPQVFTEIQRSIGWTRTFPPEVALAAWDSFVAACAEGYDMGIDEYFNDMSVRRVLERALADDRLREMPESPVEAGVPT